MRVLVTGATGFVGHYLCKLLLDRRHEVWGTFLQKDPGLPAAGLQLVPCDLRDFAVLQAVVKQVRPQQVYHLAALSSVRDSFDDAKSVYEANFGGTFNLLEAIRSLQPSARVLLVGSAHVYGKVKRAELPVTEEHALAPDSPYGVSKAAADLLGHQFFQAYRMKVIRARPFNHTGPGQSTHFVCSDFARQFAAIDLGLAEPVVCVGNLRAARDFSDVRDVVRAYERLVQKGRPGEVYNIASGCALSLDRILEILQSFTSRKVGVKVERSRVRLREADVFYGSNRKLKQATGWTPEFDLKTTLYDTFRYWNDLLKAGRQA